jgi:hypothetical protein
VPRWHRACSALQTMRRRTQGEQEKIERGLAVIGDQIPLPGRPGQLTFPQAAGEQPAGLGVDALPRPPPNCTGSASARDLGGEKNLTRGGPVMAFAPQVAAPQSWKTFGSAA